MYAGKYTRERPKQPCLVMSGSGESRTYAELDSRSNQLAHLLRQHGLNISDHYAVFMENNVYYAEVCAAGARAGLYYTCINSFLTPDEVAYIVNNCQAKALITSQAKYEVASKAVQQCPEVKLCLLVNAEDFSAPFIDYEEAIEKLPTTPVEDEHVGTGMLYSSGTTGRPKGILRPLPDQPLDEPLPAFKFLNDCWSCCEGMVHLTPAPALPRSTPVFTGPDYKKWWHLYCHGTLRRGAIPGAG